MLHVSPEAAVGGNFAVVQNGDTITLDVPDRTLTLNVSDEELEKRKRTTSRCCRMFRAVM